MEFEVPTDAVPDWLFPATLISVFVIVMGTVLLYEAFGIDAVAVTEPVWGAIVRVWPFSGPETAFGLFVVAMSVAAAGASIRT